MSLQSDRRPLCAQHVVTTAIPIEISPRSLGLENKSSAVAGMGDRLATIDMGRKVEGAAVPLSVGGELGPNLTQCRLDRGLPPYQVAS